MKKTIRQQTIGALTALAVTGAMTSAQAATVLGQYVFDSSDDSGIAYQISDGVNPVGMGFEITHRNANPQYSFWDSDDLGTNLRYTRWIADFRANGEIEAQASTYYTVDGVDAAGWNSGTGWTPTTFVTGAQVSMSTANWNDSADASTDPNLGLAPGLNWTILKPEGNGLGTTYTAVGIGLYWDDLDLDGKLDLEDKYILKHAVFAESITEIDTVAKLNAAVIPEPSTFALFGLGMAAFALVRRRA
jgi:hypothetical protein